MVVHEICLLVEMNPCNGLNKNIFGVSVCLCINKAMQNIGICCYISFPATWLIVWQRIKTDRNRVEKHTAEVYRRGNK